MSIFAIVAAVVLFCLLVAGHEFGHYAAAKLLGVSMPTYIDWRDGKGKRK